YLHDLAGSAAGYGRYRRELRCCPLRLRYSRTARRYRLRRGGNGCVWFLRNHEQPGAGRSTRGDHWQGRVAVPQQARVQGVLACCRAWYRHVFLPVYLARSSRVAVLLCVLHIVEEYLQEPATLW